MKSALAVRHVYFEDLGTFEQVLKNAGYKLSYVDVWSHDLTALNPLQPDLLAVLGAPVGVYETEAYPFLAAERDLLAARLRANLPTLGICLGAQQIAAALGAAVKPSGIKEIGFSPLSLTEAGKSGPLRHLEDIPVLHWHGDIFEIPHGAMRLAATSLCANQAFSLGNNVLGLQFHPEIDSSRGLEAWFIGHASELATASIDPRTIRGDVATHGARLKQAAHDMFTNWLKQLEYPDRLA